VFTGGLLSWVRRRGRGIVPGLTRHALS